MNVQCWWMMDDKHVNKYTVPCKKHNNLRIYYREEGTLVATFGVEIFSILVYSSLYLPIVGQTEAGSNKDMG